ncbi:MULTISPECIES: helix-turn-helix domain-containing protein [unclassified Streptomyces]|uniref:helix-turn-helix domain-containing protein n=1 Tax=unclassified Streptomyces TaxID=2593676 RepID=UPI00225C0824|nr:MULTISPECIES: helix-turn-helix transcriptional regulator [unclassified Streptomyces]MCX5050548.1 helix-turn-helix domain-containing protein [Streptomyces sp. NBC_00474]MCX5060926.1 helix-turn-helix domain-containing protein [Streptomyces sp. NBC_00452]MCX5248457.1 helix-turn-helix domain-containing protein [Streptomyces sp. NBC_00201]MCX5293449.1 helix-turn-helix domain-containing protein [Streptomyces sp. NBC_00183]
MGGWQPLAEDLPPEVRHFVEQLRLLKDRTGLSLVSLGARTAYSKSSWHRYLNATQPPPRQAVLALCRIAGLADADAERFAVRWELAVKAWPRPAKPAGEESEPEYEDDPTLPWWDAPEEASGRRPGAWPLLYAALLLLLMLLVLAVGAVLLG